MSYGLRVWNTRGNHTEGAGVAMTPGRMFGHKGTKITFAINVMTGTATLASSLNTTSSTSGERMEITKSVIKVYVSTGDVLRVKLESLA